MEIKERRNKKKLCIVTGIHGNEASLFEPLKRYVEQIELENVLEIDLILANQEAADKNVRYVDQDLNRSFGIQLNDNKETRIAKNLTTSCDADLVLDLHTHTGKETFCLVSKENLNRKIQQFILCLNTKLCLVISSQVTGGKSLVENVQNSISIETGQHSSPEAVEFAKECIQKAILFLNQEFIGNRIKTRFLKAEKFLYNQSNEEILLSSKINNFVQIDKGLEIYSGYCAEEAFIPALISYSVKPGKKVLLICKEIVQGDVNHE